MQAPTLLAEELDPSEWCRVYALLCEWERQDGSFPTTMFNWTQVWWEHHAQFILKHRAAARYGTKECALPQYLTHRLLGTLSKLKAKYTPVLDIPERPTVNEWLMLLSQDPQQQRGLKSGRARGDVVECVISGTLSGTEQVFRERVVDVTGHPSIQIPRIQNRMRQAGVI